MSGKPTERISQAPNDPQRCRKEASRPTQLGHYSGTDHSDVSVCEPQVEATED